MKVRIRFKKLGMIKFISHLDMVRMFSRSFQRAGIPIKWSQGFNPTPLLSIAVPLSVGVESEDEFVDLEIDDNYDLSNFKKDLSAHLPVGIEIVEVMSEFNPTSIFQRVESTDYKLTFPNEAEVTIEEMRKGAEDLLSASEVFIPRKRKKRGKKVVIDEDIRPLINTVELVPNEGDLVLKVNLSSGADANLRPDRFLMGLQKVSDLAFDLDLVQIRKLRNYDGESHEIHD